MASYRARDLYYQRFRTVDRQTKRGPADGLLREIQTDVLTRHPDWLERIRAIERTPYKYGPRYKNRRISLVVGGKKW